ncbi:MAG TPA: FHA domain-containing protein [Anaerolineales bacterium]
MSGPVVLVLRVLLAITLDAFLVWAFVSLWHDVKQQADLLATRKIPPISLTIDRSEPGRQVRHFILPEVTIGRDPACECHVDDEAISARHARLSYHHNQWWLEDLNSANGIQLNREKIVMPTVVMSDDEFICGGTRFIISLAGDILVPPTKKI